MASDGGAGLLPISCCSRELDSVAHLLAARLQAVAEHFGSSQSTRPGALGALVPHLVSVDSPTPCYASLSRCPLRRHSSSVRAVCVNALVRICAGGDQRWSSLPRQLFFGRASPRVGLLVYFFNPAVQLVTTVSGGDASPAPPAVMMRNRLPSAVTSYSDKPLFALATMCASTRATGPPAPPTSSACDAATPGTLAGGLLAWGTTLHALPAPSTAYTATENKFSASNLSAAEYAHITQACEFNQINGSGQSGQCKGCQSGGQ